MNIPRIVLELMQQQPTNPLQGVLDARHRQIGQRALVAVQVRPRANERFEGHSPELRAPRDLAPLLEHPPMVGEERLQRVAPRHHDSEPGGAGEERRGRDLGLFARHPVARYALLDERDGAEGRVHVLVVLEARDHAHEENAAQRVARVHAVQDLILKLETK